MSRVIVHILQSLGPSARGFVGVAPVALGGVDGVFGEDFSCGGVDHGDAGRVGQDQDRLGGVCSPDPEVVHLAAAAEADVPGGIDDVAADPVVGVLGQGGVGNRLRGRGVGVGGGLVADGLVGTQVVVDLGETIKLDLQLRDVLGWGLGREPALEGLVETFDLSLGLGVTRPASVRTRRIVEVEGVLRVRAGRGCWPGRGPARLRRVRRVAR